jgi:hypothetical protein
MVNYKNYYFKNKSGNFISKKSIPGILSSFRKIYEFKESSLLEEFLKKS